MRSTMNWITSFALEPLALFLVISQLASVAECAQVKESVLYSFQGTPDGNTPTGRLATDNEGNLYGVTVYGGTLDNGCGGYCGTVFELSPPSSQNGAWTESILHDFQGLEVGDGNYPLGGAIWGKGDKLYGTTAYCRLRHGL